MAYTLKIGERAPDFNLLGTDNAFHDLSSYRKHEILIISFTCNHCPYVIGSDEITRQTVEKYNRESLKLICINSNSKNTYQEDSFENMQARMKEHKFPWDYLHDESQEIATNYGALKTPHFFVFNSDRSLIYTGRGIDNPRNGSESKINDLENAIDDYLRGSDIAVPVTNPIGCNIKWDGKDAHWMPPAACDLI